MDWSTNKIPIRWKAINIEKGINIIILTLFLALGLYGQNGSFAMVVYVPKYIEIIATSIDCSHSGSYLFANANCGFTAMISGEHPGDYPHIMKISFSYNGQEFEFIDWSSGVAEFPFARNFSETPHGGKVTINITIRPEPLPITIPNLVMTLFSI